MESAKKVKLPGSVTKNYERFIRLNYKHKVIKFIDVDNYLNDLSINRKRTFFFKSFNNFFIKSSLFQIDFDLTSQLIQ